MYRHVGVWCKKSFDEATNLATYTCKVIYPPASRTHQILSYWLVNRTRHTRVWLQPTLWHYSRAPFTSNTKHLGPTYISILGPLHSDTCCLAATYTSILGPLHSDTCCLGVTYTIILGPLHSDTCCLGVILGPLHSDTWCLGITYTVILGPLHSDTCCLGVILGPLHSDTCCLGVILRPLHSDTCCLGVTYTVILGPLPLVLLLSGWFCHSGTTRHNIISFTIFMVITIFTVPKVCRWIHK